MKIATWNVNSLKIRLNQVCDWLAAEQPDILCLQELKLEQDKFPAAAFELSGYRAAWSGQKTYNGVAIVSRLPLEDTAAGLPDLPDDPQRRVIAATVGGIRIINVYCVNGEAVGSEKFAYKKRWFAALTAYVQSELAAHQDLILLGDFNIAPADLDVHDPAKWHEKIHCSAEERAWFGALTGLGLTDTLRRIHPDKQIFTWWDYRMNGFARGLGLRIDHILCSPALAARLEDADVAQSVRAQERPSDHAPVWAAFR